MDGKKYLRCVVCGARAFGYNFDRITCESCKGKINTNDSCQTISFPLAFFRRNALRNQVLASIE